MNDCAITFPLFGGIDSGKNLLQSATSGADVIIATLASISTQSHELYFSTELFSGGKMMERKNVVMVSKMSNIILS